MKKLIFILSAFLILVSITSCRQNDQIADEYRNNLNLKSELEQKETFKNLDTDSKIRIWKSKLEQIKTKDISSEQKNLIKNGNPNLFANLAEKYGWEVEPEPVTVSTTEDKPKKKGKKK